jgi:D-sedoheptulose 7-phosphate isomerase
MQKRTQQILSEALAVYTSMNNSPELTKGLADLATACCEAIRRGNKILFAGNGGSAADAQHLTAELVNRFGYDRPAIAAISLSTDTSVLTSVSNDSHFEYVFARQVEALGNKGDILVLLSTSGNSTNIIRAAEVAKRKDVIVAGFTGSAESKVGKLCNYVIKIPSDCTPRIQEGHILAGHILCDLIEGGLFPASK